MKLATRLDLLHKIGTFMSRSKKWVSIREYTRTNKNEIIEFRSLQLTHEMNRQK